MPNRADLYTAAKKKQIYFSDFPTNFDVNLVTKNLGIVTNEADAKIMIRNLVLTIQGERFFQPKLGSNINLFEPIDAISAQSIHDSIVESITNWLKFVQLQAVSVQPDYTNQLYNVSITFSLINSRVPVSVNLVLKRVR
jgi:phage baseplate assembly protein W